MANSFLAQMKAAVCRNSTHAWGEWEQDAAVCNETRVCGRCGAEETRQVEHKWGDWEYGNNTCIQARGCTHCGEKGERQGQHAYVETICKDFMKCKRCSSVIELSNPKHSWKDWQNTAEYNCGNGQKVRECKNCHKIEVSKKYHHTLGEWKHIGERCVTERECQVCGYKESKDEHTWDEWVSVDACHRNRRCKICSKMETTEEHAWGEWIYDAKCNCSRSCNRCGSAEKLGIKHDYERIKITHDHSKSMGSGDDWENFYNCEWKCKRCGDLQTKEVSDFMGDPDVY